MTAVILPFKPSVGTINTGRDANRARVIFHGYYMAARSLAERVPNLQGHARRATVRAAMRNWKAAADVLDVLDSVDWGTGHARQEDRMLNESGRRLLYSVHGAIIGEYNRIALRTPALYVAPAEFRGIAPANLTEPLPARTRRTKKEGLRMTTKHQPGSFEAISEADGKAHIEIMKSVQHEILAKLREHRANPMNDKEAVVWIVHRSDPVLYPLAPEVRRKATSIVDVSSRSDWLELARDRPTMVPTPIYERIRDMKHDAEIVVYAHGSVSCLPTATYANMVTCPSYKDEGGRALPMGRPLSPKLVLRGDHYAFRCVVKDGGRPWVPLPPGLTVAAAQAMALEIATLAAKGTPDGGVPVFSGKKKTIASVETFADWSDRWLESREARGLTSARDDRSRLKGHVLPILGPKAVAKITRDDVENVVASLDAKVRSGALSWKTAVNVWGALSKALDDAANAKDRALRARADNPAAGVRGPDLGTKKVKTFLYPAEVSALLTSELVPLTFRRAVALAVYLGMRLGELHALRWSDVDLTEGTVLVHQAWDRKGKKTKAPKSNATRRFTFEAEARPLLAALHEETGGKGKVLDVPNYPNAASDLRDYLQKVGVTRPDLFVTDATRKQLSFHDLRATCLTWMALRGDNVLKIKARAGHADLQTTEGYVRTAGELTNVSPTSVFAPLPRALYAVTTDQIAGQNEEEVSEKPAENLAERNGNRTRQGRSRAPRRF